MRQSQQVKHFNFPNMLVTPGAHIFEVPQDFNTLIIFIKPLIYFSLGIINGKDVSELLLELVLRLNFKNCFYLLFEAGQG